MAQDYKFTESGGVIHLATGMSIPNAPGNRHWQQYLEYVAAGGETLPWRTTEEWKQANSQAALALQKAEIEKLKENQVRKDLGLPPVVSDADEESLKEYILQMQGVADNPPADEAYNPPLPPGVTPPAVKSLSVSITRQEGWQGALGFKVVLKASSEDYVPTNLALAVYSGANCNGYLYTTGTFQLDAETGEYFAVCPPGQEPGDADVHMGLLYGAAQLSCFTLAAGTMERIVYAYEEI